MKIQNRNKSDLIWLYGYVAVCGIRKWKSENAVRNVIDNLRDEVDNHGLLDIWGSLIVWTFL